VAEFESWREVVKIKQPWLNLNLGDINGLGRIWPPRETYFENFDNFVAKDIELNGHGQI